MTKQEIMPTITEKDKSIIIQKIAKRAQAMNLTDNCVSLQMDLDFVNEVRPLRLVDLLFADNLDFSHDICGIMRNFNRKTLKLENFFLPRFSETKVE